MERLQKPRAQPGKLFVTHRNRRVLGGWWKLAKAPYIFFTPLSLFEWKTPKRKAIDLFEAFAFVCGCFSWFDDEKVHIRGSLAYSRTECQWYYEYACLKISYFNILRFLPVITLLKHVYDFVIGTALYNIKNVDNITSIFWKGSERIILV